MATGFAARLPPMRSFWLVLCSLVAACAQPPTKELDMTADRVARAGAAEAKIYAEEDYTAAEAALAEARRSLAEQRYRAAIEAASLASIRADEAYARAVLRKQRMTRQARRQLLEILALLEEARSVGVEPPESESMQALAGRLGELERELERGASANVYQEGLLLKNEALELLNRLRRESLPAHDQS